jgi:hypothetical protein
MHSLGQNNLDAWTEQDSFVTFAMARWLIFRGEKDQTISPPLRTECRFLCRSHVVEQDSKSGQEVAKQVFL